MAPVKREANEAGTPNRLSVSTLDCQHQMGLYPGISQMPPGIVAHHIRRKLSFHYARPELRDKFQGLQARTRREARRETKETKEIQKETEGRQGGCAQVPPCLRPPKTPVTWHAAAIAKPAHRPPTLHLARSASLFLGKEAELV